MAAFAVVIYHFRSGLHLSGLLGRLADEGRVGVCFFFVLSGFILVYNYGDWFQAETRRAKEFYAARVARVYPMHLAALALMTLVTVCQWRLLPLDVRQAPPQAVVGSWVTNLLLVQTFVPRLALHWGRINGVWNTPAWTLSLEALFYAVFPFFIRRFFGATRSVKTLLNVLAGFLALQLLSSVAVSSVLRLSEQHHVITEGQFSDARDITTALLRCWEFLIGCILGKIYLEVCRQDPKASGLHNSTAVQNGVLIVVCAALLGITSVPGRPPGGGLSFEWLRQYILWTPLFGVLILTLAFGPTFLTGLLEHPTLVLLGEASYSLYMIHYIAWRIVDTPAGHGFTLPATVSSVVIAITIALSVLCYRRLETPARRVTRRLLTRTDQPVWRMVGHA